MAGPTLSGLPAPVYWATNVLAYPEVPRKRLMIVKLSIPVGIAAARASVEYQDRNIRSTNCWMDQEPVLKTSGKAINKTCL